MAAMKISFEATLSLKSVHNIGLSEKTSMVTFCIKLYMV